MKQLIRATALLFLWFLAQSAWSFDHQHSQLAQVLEKHVQWNKAGTATSVDYPSLKAQPGPLEDYLAQLSAVERETFDSWNKDRQLAFLINAYNAFTLKLIVDHYPVDSIRVIGRFWQSPWKRRFFTLLGEKMYLDRVEHEIIREPGVYDEPRIHFAVNCAAIGCPALRTEPFVAEKLDSQLEDSTERFLRDETRNRYRDGVLEVSSIFKWYREDFQRGWRGTDTVAEFLLRYSEVLSLSPEDIDTIESGRAELEFLSYDWALNDWALNDGDS